jgi:penicillin-insensitive murein endopeptidase
MSATWSRLARVFAFGLAITAAPGVASAAKTKSGTTKVSARAKGSSKKGAQSIGAPNHGKLAGAVRLRGSKFLRQKEGGHSWGLPQLVHLLTNTAGVVARKHHGSQMFVGDLSGKTGGHLDRHNSHQSGRDADVGFYVMNSKGKPMSVKRFIAFDDAGNARDVPGARFDDARNWTMIEAMLKSEKAHVRYLFIANSLKARLLAHATKKHVSKELIERAAAAMMSPADADLHDDHVHVRIACPESMRDVCVEESTARDGGEKPVAAEKPADSKPEVAAKDDAADAN